MATTETNAEVLARCRRRRRRAADRRAARRRRAVGRRRAGRARRRRRRRARLPWDVPDDVDAGRPAARGSRPTAGSTPSRSRARTRCATRSSWPRSRRRCGRRSTTDVLAVAVGPVTADALRDPGVDRVVEPVRARLGSMMHALAGELEARASRLRQGAARGAVAGPGADRRRTAPRRADARRGPAAGDRSCAGRPRWCRRPSWSSTAPTSTPSRRRSPGCAAKLGPLGAGIRTVRRRGYACALEVAAADVEPLHAGAVTASVEGDGGAGTRPRARRGPCGRRARRSRARPRCRRRRCCRAPSTPGCGPARPSRSNRRSAARANVVTLAIECSKPEPMNASSAHHSTTSLAASDLVRAAIHSARHTSALHSTARQNSCGPAAASLACDDRRDEVVRPGRAIVPPAWTTPANTIEPAMLPASDATSTASTFSGDVVPPPPTLQHHHRRCR